MNTFKSLMAVALLVVATAAAAVTPEEAGQALKAACPNIGPELDMKFTAPVLQAASLDERKDRKWKDVYVFEGRVGGAYRMVQLYSAHAGEMCQFSVDAVKGKEVSVAKPSCQTICRAKVLGKGEKAYFGVDGTVTFMN